MLLGSLTAMPGWFLLRQAVTAALTANAVRPVPGFRVAVPSMVAGWLTSELAPHLPMYRVRPGDTPTRSARRPAHARTGAP